MMLSRKRKLKKVKKFLVIGGLAAIISIFTYSFYTVYKSGALEKGIVTCTSSGECYFTAHWHTYIVAEVCGTRKHMPLKKALLAEPHTHDELDIVHSAHDKLPYDSKTKTISKQPSPFQLGYTIDGLNVEFDKDKVFDKKNGDTCPESDQPAMLRMFVQHKSEGDFVENLEFRDYEWKDKDIIVLIFDDRSTEQIKQYLDGREIQWPKLGRG